MHTALTPDMVASLARSAGFEFSLERCALLAPQLEWLLTQGDLLAALGLENEEPVTVLRPDTAVSLAGREPEHG